MTSRLVQFAASCAQCAYIWIDLGERTHWLVSGGMTELPDLARQRLTRHNQAVTRRRRTITVTTVTTTIAIASHVRMAGRFWCISAVARSPYR